VLKLLDSGAMIAGVLILGSAARLMAQGGSPMHREVQVDITEPSSPVAVTKVAFNGSVVQKGRYIRAVGTPQDAVTPFVASGDWIRGLTVYVLNRTNKPIEYLNTLRSLSNFPRPGTMPPTRKSSVTYFSGGCQRPRCLTNVAGPSAWARQSQRGHSGSGRVKPWRSS
jgi:hypothetical protein